MNKNLIIIGAGGHGKVVADIANKMCLWSDIFFLDDNISIKSNLGFKVIGQICDAEKFKSDSDFFVAIGNNDLREEIQNKLEEDHYKLVTLIHPSSVISADVIINIGTVIMASVVINASCRIGKGCIINTSSSIDHDSIINDFVHISPGTHLAGNVSIGENSWLGIGCVIINNITICDSCIIGAGAVVIENISKKDTYVGVPAKSITSIQ